jgi:hypothetical protein
MDSYRMSSVSAKIRTSMSRVRMWNVTAAPTFSVIADLRKYLRDRRDVTLNNIESGFIEA